MAKKNLAKLAKETTTKLKSEKKLTPEEERDLRAKATVEELTKDIDLTLGKKEIDDLIEIDGSKNENNFNWLQEQVGLLTEENERLRKETEAAKQDYKKIFDEIQAIKSGKNNVDPATNQNLINLFMDLQNNLLGNNSERTSWVNADIKVLLGKMSRLFPFLQQYIKY